MPLLKVTNRYSAWQRESALRITEVHVLAFHHGATEDTEKGKPSCTFIQNTRFQNPSASLSSCPVFLCVLRGSVVKPIVYAFE